MTNVQLTEQKIAEITADLKERFLLYDHDGNNVINIKELGAVLRGFGENPTEEELRNLMKELDSDGSGLLDLPEFLKLMENTDRLNLLIKRRLTESQIAEIRAKFAELDDDNDGAIDKRELRNVIKSFGHNPTNEELDELMKELDTDNNNLLEFPEFLELMQHHSKYINGMLQKR